MVRFTFVTDLSAGQSGVEGAQHRSKETSYEAIGSILREK